MREARFVPLRYRAIRQISSTRHSILRYLARSLFPSKVPNRALFTTSHFLGSTLSIEDSIIEDGSGREALVPKAVVSRLSLYLRELQHLSRSEQKTISSSKLGRALGFTAAQVRKDFAYFGQFGYPGIGYRCDELIDQIKKILGTNKTWPVVLVGCGNMGQALLGYRGFAKQGFDVVAVVDVDQGVLGKTYQGLVVEHIDLLPEIVKRHSLKVAILAVPATAAAEAADQILKSGITGILNFAPVTLNVPKNVSLIEVDLAMELEQLAFSVFQKNQSQ